MHKCDSIVTFSMNHNFAILFSSFHVSPLVVAAVRDIPLRQNNSAISQEKMESKDTSKKYRGKTHDFAKMPTTRVIIFYKKEPTIAATKPGTNTHTKCTVGMHCTVYLCSTWYVQQYFTVLQLTSIMP